MTKNTSKPLLLCTVGLPRSGKTTWAKAFSADHGVPVVNPDSIRLALHGQRFAPEAEPFVWAVAKVMVRALFLAGHTTVVLDATNLTRKRRDEWLSEHWDTGFVPMAADKAECLRRAQVENDETIIPVIRRMEFEAFGADETVCLALGSTGHRPREKAGDGDEGQLKLALAADHGNRIVRLDFGKNVTWLGLTPDDARNLCALLMVKAEEIEKRKC